MKGKTRELAEVTPRRELSVLDDMDRMFENLLTRGWMRPFREMWPDLARLEEAIELHAPRLDVIDRDDEVLVRAELPGVKRDDLAVEMAGGLLTIRGEKRHEEKVEKGEAVRTEIAYGAFKRTIALPTGLDQEQVKAEFHDGILEVHLPKLEKTERRQIEIS